MFKKFKKVKEIILLGYKSKTYCNPIINLYQNHLYVLSKKNFLIIV